MKINKLKKKAFQEKKSMPYSIGLLIFTPFLFLGLYYWFYDEIIFSYNVVSPFSGFFIFISIAIIWVYLCYRVFKSNWKEHNQEIDDAKRQLEDYTKSSTDSEEIVDLKKEIIERKIADDTITTEEYKWFNERYCWCCGQEHSGPKFNYEYYASKTSTWKEGAVRYSKEFTRKANVLLCESCYKKLKKNDNIRLKNDIVFNQVNDKVTYIFAIITIIVVVLFSVIEGFSTKSFENFFATLFGGGVIGFIVCFGFGQLITIPITSFIVDSRLTSGEPIHAKYSFNKIPVIREFLKKRLRG
ncbi:MAG: hypothetical protein IKV15_02570 [Bacteroidaceae bacterium]|nr:hypothetical protein [Bacteroidaceae bacterium]